MCFIPRLYSKMRPNATQNTQLRNLKKLPMPNLRRIKQLHFITSQTQIPTQHVLLTTKDPNEKDLKAFASGDPRTPKMQADRACATPCSAW